VIDHALPIGKMVNGQYYCTLLQDKMRPAVHCKQPEWFEYGVILLQNSATPHRHWKCKIWCDVGAEVFAHSPPSSDFALITGCLHM